MSTPFPLNQSAINADIERIRSHIHELLEGASNVTAHDLVRQVMAVLWAHEDDPLVLTACIWALNAIIQHDPSTQPTMSEVGVLELLHRFLKMDTFGRMPVKRYAVDLIAEICKPHMQRTAPEEQQHNVGDFVQPVNDERPVTGFLPYFLDKSNAFAFDDIFPSSLDYESPTNRRFAAAPFTPKRKRERPAVLPALKSPSSGRRYRGESTAAKGRHRATVTKLSDIDPLAAGPQVSAEYSTIPDELLGDFSSDVAPLKAEQYIQRQQAILQRLFNPSPGSAPKTARTQHSIILRLFELCKNVDTEGKGFLPAHQFRCILQCVCYWLQSTELSELMPHANSETTIRYDELLVAGRVTLIQQTETPLLKKVSYKAWLDKQRKSNGTHSNTWKSHILWFRQTRAEACVWLMRRANRAYNHLAIIGQTERQLMQYGLRAKTFLELRNMGERACRRGHHRSDIVERFQQRIHRAKVAIVQRTEAHKFLCAKAADALWLRKLEGTTLTDVQRHGGNGSPSKDYQWALNRRAYQAHAVRQLIRMAEKASRVYLEHIQLHGWLMGKVKVARAAIGRRTQAVRWLVHRAYAATDAVRAKKLALEILAQKAKQGFEQILRRAETYTWLSQCVVHARECIARRNSAHKWLLARVYIVKGRDFVFIDLRERGSRAIETCLLREESFQWLSLQGTAAKSNGVLLFEGYQHRQAVDATQHEVHAWLVERAAAARAHSEATYQNMVWLVRRAKLAKVAIGEQARAWSELLTLSSHAVLHSFSRFAKKGKVEREKVRGELRRIQASDKRRQRELKGQPQEAQWKAELQEAFSQICRGYSHPHHAPGEESLNMLQFRRMICGGRYKLLNISVEQIPDCFRFVDADKSGAVSFSELFNWFRHEANTRLRQGKSVKVRCADIMSAQERAAIAAMHMFERRLQTKTILERAEFAAIR